MAEPYLNCPPSWLKATLEPNKSLGLIDKVDSGGTPSTTDDSLWDGDIPWLTPKEITNLNETLFVTRTERMITKAGLDGSAAKLLPPGTVMLSKRAPIGAVAVNAIPMSTNQGFLNFRCGPKLRPLYLAFWLKVNRPYLDLIANGSTYPELYVGDLFELEISVPAIEVQDKIVRAISSLQLLTLIGLPLEQACTDPEDLVKYQNQSRRLSAIRDKILPLLLSGQIDVEELRLDSKVKKATESVRATVS